MALAHNSRVRKTPYQLETMRLSLERELCVRDLQGKEMRTGDLVRVYHFTDSRRRRHYMYKWLREYHQTKTGYEFFKASHLDTKNQSYRLEGKGGIGYCEIVQRGETLDEAKKRGSSLEEMVREDFFLDTPRAKQIYQSNLAKYREKEEELHDQRRQVRN